MLGYTSAVVNGQLVDLPPEAAIAPLSMGASFTGPGYYPLGGQYLTPPVLPSPTANMGAAAYSPDGSGGVNFPTAGKINSDGSVNFFSVKKSPLLWVIGLLVVSLVMLHKIHFR